MNQGERQVAPDLSGIRRDHTARYDWASSRLPPNCRILDYGCGVGYGAWMLAVAGHRVVAIDRDSEAIEYAKQHYSHENVEYVCADASWFESQAPKGFDVGVCFECIEHLADPAPVVAGLAKVADFIVVSVPNEDKYPHKGVVKFHHRHYFPYELAQILYTAGKLEVVKWLGQEGMESPVGENVLGRTIIAEATPTKKTIDFSYVKPTYDFGPAPEHVALVGLGPTCMEYLNTIKMLGSRKKFCDETWGINALGDVFQCDRIFHMDDVRIQEIRAAAKPDGNIAAMLEWMKIHPGPIITSRTHPDYPGLVEFPLEAVMNSFHHEYFNGTAAYAVVYAMLIGVKKLSCFGLDYSYRNSHSAEKGRGCVEYWLGRATERGMLIAVAKQSSLLDAYVPYSDRFYGYDTVSVDVSERPDRTLQVSFKEIDKLPTAEEIEARYDHSQPTTPAHLL